MLMRKERTLQILKSMREEEDAQAAKQAVVSCCSYLKARWVISVANYGHFCSKFVFVANLVANKTL